MNILKLADGSDIRIESSCSHRDIEIVDGVVTVLDKDPIESTVEVRFRLDGIEVYSQEEYEHSLKEVAECDFMDEAKFEIEQLGRLAGLDVSIEEVNSNIEVLNVAKSQFLDLVNSIDQSLSKLKELK